MRTNLFINPLMPNRRLSRYKNSYGCRTDVDSVVAKSFFKYSCKNISRPRVSKTLNGPPADAGTLRDWPPICILSPFNTMTGYILIRPKRYCFEHHAVVYVW